MTTSVLRGHGVHLQAVNTTALDSLRSLAEAHDIPVATMGVGPVQSVNVWETAFMLDAAPRYAVVLAWAVPVTPDAWTQAHELRVSIFVRDHKCLLLEDWMFHTENWLTESS